MRAYRAGQICHHLRRLQNQNNFDFAVAPTVLYLLAAPSTPEEAREEILERAAALPQSLQIANFEQGVWEMGQLLTEVKHCLDPGDFIAWIEAEFALARTSAHRFMRVYETFPNLPQMFQIGTFEATPSILYLLAAPSTPDEAREEILERAAAGEQVTVATTQAVISQHKAPETPTTETPGQTAADTVVEGEVVPEVDPSRGDPGDDEDSEGETDDEQSKPHPRMVQHSLCLRACLLSRSLAFSRVLSRSLVF